MCIYASLLASVTVFMRRAGSRGGRGHVQRGLPRAVRGLGEDRRGLRRLLRARGLLEPPVGVKRADARIYQGCIYASFLASVTVFMRRF